MSIFSGLAGLGLGDLEDADLFGEKEKAEKARLAAEGKLEPEKPKETDLILDKAYKCPVCDGDFSCKVMKTGKAKLLGIDKDLRARYDGIDAQKYDVILCPRCKYTALARYFPSVLDVQRKLIRENISGKAKASAFDGETYSYDEAIERYQLALANAIVKKAKNSEKAFVCLKSGWLLRGYIETLEAENGDEAKIKELKAHEEEYLLNAFNGFSAAIQSESFPMCGMDEMTMNYLLAVLGARFKKYDVASKMIAIILQSSSAAPRIKDKARDLKDEIMAEIKAGK